MSDTSRLPGTARTSRGFSLIELLVAVAVTAVLLATAGPALGTVADRMKASSFANMFVAQLQLARSEAIKRNHRVVACGSANGVNCARAGGWEQGWIVFDDANNNGARDDGEQLVQRVDPLPPGWRISGNQNVGRYISFEPSGETRMVSGAFQAGTITVCREQAAHGEARQIIINSAGRPRLQKSTVAGCA